MKQIIRQTSWLIIAQVLTKIVGFFYTIFLAKSLGVSDFGLFTVALAYFAIISSIAEFGFNKYLVREIAKDRLKTTELMCNVIMLRLTLTSLLFGVFAIFLYIFDADKMRVSLILLSVLAVLPQSIALTFDSIFVALQKLQFSAASLLVSSLLTALAGLLLISFGFGAYGAVNALIFGQLAYALVTLVLLYKIAGLHLSSIKLVTVKKAIRGSLPYGLLGVLGLLYFRVDAIILSYLRGNFETGIYSAAYKFLEAAVLVPASISLAIFPVMARLQDTDLKKLRKLYHRTIATSAVGGILVALGYYFILPIILPKLLPDYSLSVHVIKILALSLPFMFIQVSASQVLLSSEKNLKQLVFITFSLLTFSVLFNLIFIPKFGYLGAAWVTVASDIFAAVILIGFLQRYFFRNV